MALRGTLTHRKTRRLAKALGIMPCFALGILEALWHVTSEQTPAGDIGRMSNQDMADEMFYDGDADELVDALVLSGWLDVHPECRLAVHDWAQHADQATKRKVARHGGEMTSQRLVMTSQVPVMDSPPVSSIQSPEPVPEPEPDIPPKSPKGDRVRFVKPTVAEVEAYMREREIPCPERLARKFIDHYDSNGWKVGGKSPMKDWQAAIRNWEDRHKDKPPGGLLGSRNEFLEAMQQVTGGNNAGIVRAGT